VIDRLERDVKVTDADITSTLDRLNFASEFGWAELPPYVPEDVRNSPGPVGRALAREQLMTSRQAVRPRCRRRYPALYAGNVSVGGNAQR
jgi:hypothetical protein